MSAGRFQRSRYQGDDTDDVYPIRVQPETLALNIDGTVNAPPTAATNQSVSAKVSGSRREFGVSARRVRITFTAAVPEGYAPNQVIALPILTAEMYNNIDKGDSGSYLGLPVTVVGKTPEYIN